MRREDSAALRAPLLRARAGAWARARPTRDDERMYERLAPVRESDDIVSVEATPID
jgi:hypothetical protein